MKRLNTLIYPILLCLALGAASSGAAFADKPKAKSAKTTNKKAKGKKNCDPSLIPALAADAGDKLLYDWADQAAHHQAKFIGDQIDMDRVKSDLEALTGEKPMPDGTKLPDRSTSKNRERTREFIRSRLKELGYAPTEEKFEIATSSYSYDEDEYDDYYSSRSSSRSSSSSSKAKKDIAVNIMVEIPGTKFPNEVVEVSAHYDTVYEDVPGADDNGSGLTSALEMARVFKQFAPERTLRIVFADLEEKGQKGTEHHVSQLKNDPRKFVGALVIDMIGYTDKAKDGEFVLEVGELEDYHAGDSGATKDAASQGSKNMAEAILYQFHRYSGREVKIKPLTSGSAPDTGDHGPYWDEGYSALFAAAPFNGDAVNPHYHKSTDKIAHIVWPYFSGILRAMTEGVACLTGAQLACDAHQKLLAEMKPKYDGMTAAEIVPATIRVPAETPRSSYSSSYSSGWGYGGSSYSSSSEPLVDTLDEEEAIALIDKLTASSSAANERGEKQLIHASPRYASVGLALVEELEGAYRTDARRIAKVIRAIKFQRTPEIDAALEVAIKDENKRYDNPRPSSDDAVATSLKRDISDWTLTPAQIADLEKEAAAKSNLTEDQAMQYASDLKAYSSSTQAKAVAKLIAAKPTSEKVILKIIDALWSSWSADLEAAGKVLTSIDVPTTAAISIRLTEMSQSSHDTRREIAEQILEHLTRPAAVETPAPVAPAIEPIQAPATVAPPSQPLAMVRPAAVEGSAAAVPAVVAQADPKAPMSTQEASHYIAPMLNWPRNKPGDPGQEATFFLMARRSGVDNLLKIFTDVPAAALINFSPVPERVARIASVLKAANAPLSVGSLEDHLNSFVAATKSDSDRAILQDLLITLPRVPGSASPVAPTASSITDEEGIALARELKSGWFNDLTVYRKLRQAKPLSERVLRAVIYYGLVFTADRQTAITADNLLHEIRPTLTPELMAALDAAEKYATTDEGRKAAWNLARSLPSAPDASSVASGTP